MDTLKESLAPKTFSKISYAAIIIWFVINVIFFGIFAEVENTESRYDFSRGGVKSENIDFVRGECFEKYEKQNNKYGVPVCGFVIVNFFLIGTVCVMYSQTVRNTVDHLTSSSRNCDPESGQSRDQENPMRQTTNCRHKLFIAYCCQLSTRLVPGVLFVLLQTQLLYPLKFSSTFDCYHDLISGTNEPRNSSDAAPNSTLHKCHNQRAVKKTFWIYAVLVVNGIFVKGTLTETVYILLRACIERNFMEDSDFLKIHLNASHDKSHQEPKQQEGRRQHETVLPQPREQGNHPTQVELQSEPQKQDDVPLQPRECEPPPTQIELRQEPRKPEQLQLFIERMKEIIKRHSVSRQTPITASTSSRRTNSSQRFDFGSDLHKPCDHPEQG